MIQGNSHSSAVIGVSALPLAAVAPKPVKLVSLEAIAARAYEKYLARARAHGQDREDWLSAEKELLGE